LQVLSLSPFRREPFLRPTSLGQGFVLDRRDIAFVISFDLNLPLETL
jgi:hypothetical protein